jgi:MoaA/NifB/PqqE/SkfB family radical SAM enzyme
MPKIVAIEDLQPDKDLILRVEWNLGKRCNFNCSYCGNDLHDNVSEHIPWEVFTNTIDKIKQGAGNRDIKISFTGGEPFVHPQFVEMLEYAKQNGISKCSVTTNGSPPLKIYERAVEYLDYLTVSYHFEFAKHERLIDNIIAIRKLKNTMHVNIMFLPGKLDECIELMDTFQQHDVHYSIRRIRPRTNSDRTDWLRPYSDGMLGLAPRQHEINMSKFGAYYSTEELEWLEANT